MTEYQPHFEVSKEGLAKLLEKRGKGFAVLELLQNAFDEDATRVDVTLEPTDRRGYYRLTVEDDDPDGFTDLTHAYRLFEESEKKADATKRGRFNLGEKLVVAVCDELTIHTTTGKVEFSPKGRLNKPRQKRDRGSIVTGTIRMNRAEYDEACAIIETVLIPEGLTVTFNGRDLIHRGAKHTFEASLPTEIADAEGFMRSTTRKTAVAMYDVLPGETAHIYELGIPVVETDLPWHIDVSQKVPINLDRDNVTPKYRAILVRHATEAMYDQLTPEQASSPWVDDALADPDLSDEALDTIMTSRFGEKRTIFDPSDPEANKLAMSQGYTVIPSRSFNRDQWDNIKRSGSTQPSGRVTPSPKPYGDGDNGNNYLPEDQWTPAMVAMSDYAKALAKALMGVNLRVYIENDRNNHRFAACYLYQGAELTFNLQTLGRKWFAKGMCVEVNDLLIHEFGHEYGADHLDKRYFKALSSLGAKMVQLALDDPEWFQEQEANFRKRLSVAQS